VIASLPFGARTLEATLPDRTVVVSNEEPRTLPPIADLDLAVRDALGHPLDHGRLRDLVRPSASVAIAFDDATVPFQGPIRRVAITAVLEELEAAGVSPANVTLICANSLHRKLRREELARLIGEELVREFGPRLVCHDAEDRDLLVDLGTTPGGYPVELHRLAVESDLTVYVNARYIRGFSGGWKSVCVGLSTYRTIKLHHTPDGMSMAVHGNRMHAMLDEMGAHYEARTGRRVFKIDTLAASLHETARVFAGSVDATRRAALDAIAALFPPRRKARRREPVDVFVYGVPDTSPYAVWARSNPILTLISYGLGYLGGLVEALGRPGCTVIMATPAPEQWDEVHHPSYREVWERVLPAMRDPYRIMQTHADAFAARPDYIERYRHAFAFHPVHAIMAVYPLKRLAHVARVIVAGAEDPAVPRHLGFEASATVEEAIALAEKAHGPGCAIAWIRQPSTL
jgi:hypothetical protein